jgi:hypothetical protein
VGIGCAFCDVVGAAGGTATAVEVGVGVAGVVSDCCSLFCC